MTRRLRGREQSNNTERKQLRQLSKKRQADCLTDTVVEFLVWQLDSTKEIGDSFHRTPQGGSNRDANKMGGRAVELFPIPIVRSQAKYMFSSNIVAVLDSHFWIMLCTLWTL